MDSERGRRCWNWHIWSLQLIFLKCLVRSEVLLLSISSALHSWMASSSEQTENHFCFRLMVPASHPCHVLICRVAALSVKRLGMIIDLHKKCMTLFVSCRTRDFPDSFTNCVHTFCRMSDQDLFWHLWKLIVFWIYIYSAAGFKHIIRYL